MTLVYSVAILEDPMLLLPSPGTSAFLRQDVNMTDARIQPSAEELVHHRWKLLRLFLYPLDPYTLRHSKTTLASYMVKRSGVFASAEEPGHHRL